ncbi:MAG: serine hydrolase [Candidatus Omnitrophota bacterium]|nr:serine hydrolase [Candidatus Omnitrophota bacterium]
MKNKHKIFLLIFAVGMIVSLYLVIKTHADYAGTRKNRLSLRKRNIAWKTLDRKVTDEINNFDAEVGVIIKDLSRGWQIVRKQNKLFPAASLVKIPIMVSCFYAAENGKISLEGKVPLNDTYKVPGSGWLKNIRGEAEFSVAQLIDLMITESDNTAANMLIDLLGLDYLNKSFRKFGLMNSDLSRKMMDFSDRRNGIENYTTARDISYILEKIYRGELINQKISKQCLELLQRQKMRDRIPARLPANTIVAHKTGLERGICHDAGIVFTPNGDFLICVLVKHKNKTARPAKKFIARIAFLTYNYYTEQ